jgi:hypothetical protein
VLFFNLLLLLWTKLAFSVVATTGSSSSDAFSVQNVWLCLGCLFILMSLVWLLPTTADSSVAKTKLPPTRGQQSQDPMLRQQGISKNGPAREI